MTVKGKHVVIAIVTLAFVLASGNLIYQWLSSHRVRDYWGSEVGGLIANGDQAEIMLLRPLTEEEVDSIFGVEGILNQPEELRGGDSLEGPVTSIGESLYCIGSRGDIRAAGGVTHVRKALLKDSLYDWQTPAPQGPIEWRYALRFADHDDSCFVYLDEACLLVLHQDQSSPLRIKAQDGKSPLSEFVREQFSQIKPPVGPFDGP